MYRYNLIDFFPLNKNLYFIFLNYKKSYMNFPFNLKMIISLIPYLKELIFSMR